LVKNSLSVPETDAAARPDENVALADLAVDIKASFAAARAGAKAEEYGRAAWRDNSMKLGKGLLLGRERHQNDNNAFNVWLNDNGLGEDLISKDDRAALIRMAEHLEIAERVLATTQRRSWQLIWREEIAPEVEVSGGFRSVTKTPENPSANPRGGRPRRTRMRPGRPRRVPDRPHASIAQLTDSPVPKRLGDMARVDSTDASAPLYLIESPDVGDTAHELTERCSGPEWRTRPELAAIVGRSEDVIKEALTRLRDDRLVEQRKRVGSVHFEYRIGGDLEREHADLRQQVHDLERQVCDLKQENAELRAKLDAAESVEIRILELEDVVHEHKDEIARLKADNAKRRAQLDATESGSPVTIAEQLERLEKEEAEQAAPAERPVH
jgi:hypothetical protein